MDELAFLDSLQYVVWAFVGICIIGIFVFIYMWSKRHRDFINRAKSIKLDMPAEGVFSIMGCSATTIEEDGDKVIAIWEKNQWKGIQHGGTITRSIKVTFADERVVSISSKNLDSSTFW